MAAAASALSELACRFPGIGPRPTTHAGGWWDITSAALADFKLDTAPGPLPDIARELAYLDVQGGRPGANGGSRLDSNVRPYKGPPRG